MLACDWFNCGDPGSVPPPIGGASGYAGDPPTGGGGCSPPGNGGKIPPPLGGEGGTAPPPIDGGVILDSPPFSKLTILY